MAHAKWISEIYDHCWLRYNIYSAGGITLYNINSLKRIYTQCTDIQCSWLTSLHVPDIYWKSGCTVPE